MTCYDNDPNHSFFEPIHDYDSVLTICPRERKPQREYVCHVDQICLFPGCSSFWILYLWLILEKGHNSFTFIIDYVLGTGRAIGFFISIKKIYKNTAMHMPDLIRIFFLMQFSSRCNNYVLQVQWTLLFKKKCLENYLFFLQLNSTKIVRLSNQIPSKSYQVKNPSRYIDGI